MRCASIDIGTNTLRLQVADLTDAGVLEPKLARRYITRLGGGFTKDKGIDEASAVRAFEALDEIKLILDKVAPEFVEAVATSVVRSAVNRDWFVGEAKKRLGSAVRVISGEDEARLSLLGVASVLSSANPDKKRLVMDIGGGSTEFIFADNDGIKTAISLELGVVHLTEKYLKSDPPADAELIELQDEIEGAIAKLDSLLMVASIDPQDFSSDKGALFIGTAGTVTTLSAMRLKLTEYDPKVINGSILTKNDVVGLFKRLKKQTMQERLQDKALEEGREDLIIAGTLIVLMVMRAFGFKEMTVSDAGLLEGIILEQNI